MMSFLCALNRHRGQTILERDADNKRVRLRCLNCWTVGPWMVMVPEDDPEPPDTGAENPHGFERPL